MSALLVLIALPLMIAGGLLLDIVSNDDADDAPEDAAPEDWDEISGEEPLV